mgnify:FL=1
MSPAKAGAQIPSGCTTPHAASTRTPTEFLCDPNLRHPCASRGSEPGRVRYSTWVFLAIQGMRGIPGALEDSRDSYGCGWLRTCTRLVMLLENGARAGDSGLMMTPASRGMFFLG